MNNKKFWILEVTQVIVLIAVLFCWRSVRNEDIEMSSSEELYYRETEATEEVFENLSQNTETEMEMENEVETESSEISYEEDSAEANNRLTITTLAKDGAIPTVDGKTYQERQGAFDQLEWDTITGKAIEEEWKVDEESKLFAGESLDLYIVEGRAWLNTDEEDESKEKYLNPYVLSQNEESIILEGVDWNSRKYYQYEFCIDKVFIRGGNSVDVITDESLPIVGACEKGTFTFEDGLVQLWQYGEVACSAKIPIPVDITAEELFSGNCNYNAYIDAEGNLIILQTYEKDGKLNLEYSIVAKEVEKVITSAADFNLLIKSKNGEYGVVESSRACANYHFDTLYEDEPLQQTFPIIWLNRENIERLRFCSCISVSGGENAYTRLHFWSLFIDVKDYDEKIEITIYKPCQSVDVEWEWLDELKQDFSIDEYDEKYEELVRKTKELEKLQSGEKN